MADLGVTEIKSARKRYKCDYCEHGFIEVKEPYSKWTTVFCDVIYHVKQCKVCRAFAKDFPEDAHQCYTDEMLYSDMPGYADFAAEYVMLEE